MAMKTETVRGTIKDIRFHNEENGYTIAVFETKEGQITAVGNMAAPAKGMNLTLTGSYEVHRKYGEQFRFSEYEELMPEDETAVEQFLSSGVIKGVGPKYAAAIVAMYGRDTMEILDDAEKLMQVDGIGEKKAARIVESYREHREFAEVSAELFALGISAEQAMRIYKEYGADTVEVVKTDPYRLVDEIYGIGFRTADDIASRTGLAGDDPRRIKSGIIYTLRYYTNEGNTCLPLVKLAEKTAELLDVSRADVRDGITDLTFEGKVTMTRFEEDTVYLSEYFLAEQRLAHSIDVLRKSECGYMGGDIDSLIISAEAASGIVLGEKQRQAVRTAVTDTVSVITGGPGTGKTTIIKTIIRVLELCGHQVRIAAPTGRAAKRITETSGCEATTIHRLLEYTRDPERDFMFFGRDEDNPLDCDCVIVDEASMIDLMLMDALVKAIRPGTRLVIVGDRDQLPPVGAGNVLKDIIDSGCVETVILTDIYRQAAESLIVTNAHRINRGDYPWYNEKGGEFFLLAEPDEKKIADRIIELVRARLPAYYRCEEPMKDIQVLTPARKGALGTVGLNVRLQEALNPPDESKAERVTGDRTFREGDKVMQIRNDYSIKWRKTSDFEEGEGIFNGDVGFIREIDRDKEVMGIVFDEDKYVSYGFDMLDELELAYAVTVHKSQGCEFPVAVMPVAWFAPMLATRNLLYTAVTRAKEGVVLVGREDRLRQMVDNDRVASRYSGLMHMLCEFADENDV